MDEREEIDNSKASKPKGKRKEKNILTYMESTITNKSPKSLLYESITENRKIKVWTRSHSYVRSICIGYLIAFDRYWNLAMIDVDEIYKVPYVRSESSEIKSDSCSGNLDESELIMTKKSNRDKSIDQPISLCEVKNKNYEMRYRHINQILIRGDNVVMVSYAD